MNSQKGRMILEGKTHTGIMQDKDTPRRIYEASDKPSYADVAACRRPKGSFTICNTGANAPKTPRIQQTPAEVAGCVPRHVAEQLERMRDQGGKGKRLSRSAVVAALIVRGVQGNVDMQYGAMLKPIIETTVYNAIHSEAGRSANLALEAFYSAEEAR